MRIKFVKTLPRFCPSLTVASWLVLGLSLGGCGKSSPTVATAPSPTPAPPLAAAKGPPPAPVSAVPVDHAFDGDGFVAHDFAHGDGAFKLLVNRQWNGASVRSGHFGPGWSDANAIRLSMIDRDALLLWRGEVGWRKAHRVGDKLFEGDGGEKIEQSDKGWRVQMAGGITLTFDGEGRLTSAQSGEGPAWNYSYEKNGRLASLGTSAENTLKYSYDPAGKRVTRIDGPEGLRLDYEFDDKGRLAAVTNSRKVRIQYRYGDDGVLAAAEDQFGNRFDFTQPIQATGETAERGLIVAGPPPVRTAKDETAIKRDAFGRIISRTDESGRETRFEYNALDLPTLIAVSGEPVERRQYDEHGMLTRRERGAVREEFAYDSGGRLSAKRTAPGNEEHYEYDAEDRIARVKRNSGEEVTYEYAPNGRLIDESSSTGRKRHWNYNAAGQLIGLIDEDGLQTTYGYDAEGRLSFSEDKVHGRKTVRYAENEVTTDTPDLGVSVVRTTPWGRPILETLPGNRSTTFHYDAAGNLDHVIPPSRVPWRYSNDAIISPTGLTTALERDETGRVRKVMRGAIAQREFRYDNAGRVQEEFSAAGSAVSYKYDSATGELLELRLPAGKVSYSADPAGLARTAEGPDFLLSEKFHNDGAIAQRVYQPAKLDLKLPRDAQGRPSGVELNNLKAAYAYNARGQIERIDLPQGAIKISRDDAGRVTGLALGTAATMEIKYDRADRITRLEAKQPSGKALFVERYVYDPAGNLAERATDATPPSRFEYDRDDRLTKITEPKTARTLSYDIDGNLAAITTGNQTARLGLDELGRPTQNGATSFFWSTAGNLERTESAKEKTENRFDAADRLVSRTSGEKTWTFGYLPGGDRLWQERDGKRRWFAYLPDRLAGFKDEEGVDWLLVSLPGTDWPIALCGSNGKTFFVLADHLGSARRFVDESGAIVASVDYSPLGQPLTANGTPPLTLFAGMIVDESGLCYARQRYYDPQIARFLSLDPEIGTPGFPATHNPYAYAGNNPLRYRDPMGTDFASEVAAPDSNIFHAMTESQQAAVKEAWDGAQRAQRVLNSPMKSTPADIAAASRHLQESNAALAKLNEIGRAQYKYTLLATGPTAELSAVGKANAARNTAEAKAALEALGEAPRVGRVNFGINAENLGATIHNVRPAIPPEKALVPRSNTLPVEAGTATRGAGASAGGGGASTAWDENLFTGKSPINKSGRIPGQIEMVYDAKNGVWKPAVPSGSASSFASGAEGAGQRWLGPKVLNAGGKVLNALGPVTKIMTAIDAARLGGTMAKNFTDNLNQPFKENRAIDQAARDMANDLAKRLGELALSDPNAIILGDGRPFDPNNPEDIDEIIRNLGQNIYMGRKPFDGILKYVPKLDPNVLPKTFMGAADGDTAFETTMASARQLFAAGWTARGTARDAAAAVAREEAEAQAQLQSAMTTAATRAVVESDVTGVLEKSADVKAKAAAVQAQVKTMEAGEAEMRSAIAKGDEAASKICDYAARAAEASEAEIAAWRKEATADLMAASNLLNTAQEKTDGADAGIDALQTAIGELEGFKTKLDAYKVGSALADKADVSPDAALAAAKAAAARAETERTKLTTALGEIGTIAPKMTRLLSPYIMTHNEAAVLAAEALDLADGIEEPGLFTFSTLLSAATPVIDAAIANQKAVEKAVANINLDSILAEAREVLSSAQTARTNVSAIASGVERYRPLQTASQCLALIKTAPKIAETTPSPSPDTSASPTPEPTALAQASPTASPTPTPDEKPVIVTVPDVSGAKTVGAMKAAAGPDMVGIVHATSIPPPEGSKELFAYQEPAAGSKALRGQTLHIYIYQALATAGTTPTPSPTETSPGTMPSLIGLTLDQASSRLTSNMSLGGDDVGEKPPSPEQAYTIYSQSPPAGQTISPDAKVVVTVKRYGSARAAEEPAPTPYEEVPSGPVTSAGLEGTWGGTLAFEAKDKAKYFKFDVRREGDDYLISSDKTDPIRMKGGGTMMVYQDKLNLDFNIFGGKSVDTDPLNIRVTASLVSENELQIHFKAWSSSGTKEGVLGTLRRLK